MIPLDNTALQRATSGVPEWLAVRRTAGYDHFDKLAMPTSQEEVWKYVDLDFDLADYAMADHAGPALAGADELADAIPTAAGRLQVIDGVVSSVEPVGSAAVVFDSVLVAAWEHSELLEARYGAAIPPDLDKFAAAAAAFSSDGVAMAIPAGVAVTDPFYIDVQAITPGTVSFPRVVVDIGSSAQASLVINYRSPHDARLVVVPDLEITVGQNAKVDVTIVQNWGYETRAISHVNANVGRDARVQIAEAGLGGKLSRLHLSVDLEGRGSSAEILGAFFGERDQILDYRYFMRHIGTNTDSDMFLKGGVEDEALSVFTGMIRIEESAQKTNAFQTNRNLLLSDGAAAQSVPNLEILANDVRCGHGSTVGPLDAEQRYYLMSRGLDRARSDRLQVRGFFDQALSRFPISELVAPISHWINQKYVAAQAEGRVR